MIYYFLQFDHHSFDFFVLLLKLFFLFNFTFQLKICSCPLIYFNFNFYQHFLIVFFLILDPLMWLLFFFSTSSFGVWFVGGWALWIFLVWCFRSNNSSFNISFFIKKNLTLWFSLISFRLGYLDLMIWYADLTG